MTITLADLNPSAADLATLFDVINEAGGTPPRDWMTASFADMGIHDFDLIEMACEAEDRFAVYLDWPITGTDTAADLLAAVRAAARLGELPHG